MLFRQSDLPIAQKGILLVIVPSLLLLVFLGTLTYLLDQSEQATAREARAKEVQFQSNSMMQHILSGISAVSTYALTGDPEVYQQYRNDLLEAEDHYQRTRSLVGNRKDQLAVLDHMHKVKKRLFESLDLLAKMMEDKGETEVIVRLAGLREQLESLLAIMLSDNKAFQAMEIAAAKEHPANSQLSKDRVKQFIGLGAVVALLSGVSLAVLFSREITGRLDVLLDNTVRLSKNQPLHQLLPGKDEIARLDSVFHDMAKALDIASRRERAIVDNAADVICSLDRNLQLTKTNPSATVVWGYSNDELLGKPLMDLVYAEDRDKTTQALDTVAKNQTHSTFENQLLTKSGEKVAMLWSAQWSQEEESFFCVAHDVTERHAIEQLKREFVAMVSHDLRTPLTSIQGTLTLIREGVYGQLSKAGQSAVTRSESEILRLIDLINSLLDLEKMESGQLLIDKEVVSFAALISKAVDAVIPVAQKSGIKIDAADTTCETLADGPKLVQVMVNLLANAVKFSPKGSTISISAKELPGWIEVKVEDRGRGIPESHRELIFEKFQQVEAADRKAKGGTGLGLAICKAVVEGHGGTIGVDSTVGNGSTFWFRIPLPE